MKNIQKFLLAFALLAVAVVAVQAQKQQRQPDPEKRAEKMTERMAEHLNLTEQQTAQVQTIHLKYAKQMADQHQQAGEGQGPDRAAMQQLREAQLAEIKPLLTAEQLAKFDKMQAERAERKGKGKMGHGKSANADPAQRAEHMTQRMTETLQLTDAQAVQVQAINLDFAQKAETLRSQGEGDEKAARGKLKKLRTEKKTALQSVLTEAQFKQWEAQKAERQGMHQGKRKHSKEERM